MLHLSNVRHYYLYTEGCDFRKGFEGLCGLVMNRFESLLTSGSVFIFFNGRRDRVKLLCWIATTKRTFIRGIFGIINLQKHFSCNIIGFGGVTPPDKVLKNYQGKIQTDGYGVYEHFEKNEGITLFACWAHARRKIHEVSRAYPALTEAPLRFIGQLYLIEKQIKQKEPGSEEAAQLRRYKAAWPMAAIKKWMEKTKSRLKPKMKLYRAIEYIKKRWQKLT